HRPRGDRVRPGEPGRRAGGDGPPGRRGHGGSGHRRAGRPLPLRALRRPAAGRRGGVDAGDATGGAGAGRAHLPAGPRRRADGGRGAGRGPPLGGDRAARHARPGAARRARRHAARTGRRGDRGAGAARRDPGRRPDGGVGRRTPPLHRGRGPGPPGRAVGGRRRAAGHRRRGRGRVPTRRTDRRGPPMTPAVHIEGLVYAYPGGVTALNGVDLRIEHGERVAVIGRNGAGKTTMARQLNGIAKPTAGTVTVCGTDTAGATTARLAASVGYVFQNPSDQIFAKTVRADVEFGPRNLGRSAEETARLAEAAMAATDVLDFADHHPYHLSPAERKRVALASVLAMDTPVVVLDEPTTGQDHRSVRRIERIVADLHAAGTTVIAITHDMDSIGRASCR